MIKCKLQKTREYTIIPEKEKERLKFGRYLNSTYPLPDFGTKKWIVAANIVLEEDVALTVENLDEITEQCVEFLNTPPPSKYKRGRKRTKLLYGRFDEKPYRTIIKEYNGKQYIQVFLVTGERKNRAFWGEGPKTNYLKKRKKRS